jgi:hypothetical protein
VFAHTCNLAGDATEPIAAPPSCAAMTIEALSPCRSADRRRTLPKTTGEFVFAPVTKAP